MKKSKCTFCGRPVEAPAPAGMIDGEGLLAWVNDRDARMAEWRECGAADTAHYREWLLDEVRRRMAQPRAEQHHGDVAQEKADGGAGCAPRTEESLVERDGSPAGNPVEVAGSSPAVPSTPRAEAQAEPSEGEQEPLLKRLAEGDSGEQRDEIPAWWERFCVGVTCAFPEPRSGAGQGIHAMGLEAMVMMRDRDERIAELEQSRHKNREEGLAAHCAMHEQRARAEAAEQRCRELEQQLYDHAPHLRPETQGGAD